MYRVESDPNGPCVITFDSMLEYTRDVYAAADKREPGGWNRAAQALALEKRAAFTGVRTIEAAQRLAARGLKVEGFETYDLAQDVIKELQQERILPEFAPVHDVQGMDVDIERYLSGEPECMLEYPVQDLLSTGPVVTMVVGMNYSAIATKEAILSQGRLAVALALALSACGYSLEIWSEIHTGACGDDEPYNVERYPRAIKVRAKVLEAGTSIDPAGLTYALAHPSVLRIFGFSAMHLAPYAHKDECRVGSGYGIPRKIDPADWPENAIIINPRRGLAANTLDTLREDVLSYLRNLGIIGEGEQS